ncbi:MAG: HEAT repeat domain-containing protein [bacterium]|nr:HEAT repeat domain-containing protein [bacterium]
MRSSFILVSILLVLSMGVPNGSASEITPSPLKDVQNIKIVTHQNLDKGKTQLPLSAIASRFLSKYSDLTAVEEGPYDALIEIWAAGKCNWATYGDFHIGREGTKYYTGGEISGTIRLSAEGSTDVEWSFEGKVPPLDSVSDEVLEQSTQPNPKALMNALMTSRFLSVLWAVVGAIGGIDMLEMQIKQNLEEAATQSEPPAVAASRIKALGLLDDPRAEELLFGLLSEDKPERTRAAAAIGLGYSKDEGAFEPLWEIYSTNSGGEESKLGRAVSQALSEITGLKRLSTKALLKWQKKNR